MKKFSHLCCIMFSLLGIVTYTSCSEDVKDYEYAIQNKDGVTIYYNPINNNELEVTHYFYTTSSSEQYQGFVNIPEAVRFDNESRSVTHIGERAFYGCTKLQGVSIPNTIVSIDDRAFASCTELPKIVIPNSVTIIKSNAFSGCSNLASVSFGNAVESIGDYAFLGCSQISRIDIPASVESIGIRAFEGCSNMTSLTIGDRLQVIPTLAFADCESLSRVSFGKSVRELGDYAFSGCKILRNVTLPPTLVTLGSSVFSGCDSLAKITVEAGNPVFDSRENCNAIVESSSNTLIYGFRTSTIPSSITSIAQDAFRGCAGLDTISIPTSIVQIGEGAFVDCRDLAVVVSLREDPIDIKASKVFSNCDNLVLYVPQGTREKYQKTGWAAFGTIKEIGEEEDEKE